MSDASNVVAVEGSLQEPCASEQADAGLAARDGISEEPGSDSLQILQEVKHREKKKRSKMWKCSREGRQNPELPIGGDKGG